MDNILRPEQYVARHKEAFRVAFDFLNAHFPPTNGGEWWEKTGRDIALADDDHKENPLVRELLCGVLGYLERESRMRDGKTEG